MHLGQTKKVLINNSTTYVLKHREKDNKSELRKIDVQELRNIENVTELRKIDVPELRNIENVTELRKREDLS